MQKLVCELCGSNNFTKDDDGYFVCDYCRTKYTPAQAQSMLVEGTVRVDRSLEVENLITLATNALSSGNHQEAYGYAGRALEIDSQSSAAWYLKGTSAGWLSSVQQLRVAETKRAYEQAIQYAPEDQRKQMQYRCADQIAGIAVAGDAFKAPCPTDFASMWGIWPDYIARTQEVLDGLATSYLWNPRRLPLDHYVTIATNLIIGLPMIYFQGNTQKHGYRTLTPEQKAAVQAQVDWAVGEIHKYNPGYVAPSAKTPTPRCFVVTATMGDENAAPVITLREFRDTVLVDYEAGRRFIDWYNINGPSLAERIERSSSLRTLSRIFVVGPSATCARAVLRVRAER